LVVHAGILTRLYVYKTKPAFVKAGLLLLLVSLDRVDPQFAFVFFNGMAHHPTRPVERYDGCEKHFPKPAKDGDAAIEIKFVAFSSTVSEVARIADVHVTDAGNEGNDIGAVDNTIKRGFYISFILLVAHARTAECITCRDL
jgi:hypothetical protein